MSASAIHGAYLQAFALFEGTPHLRCKAIVVIPVRNEERRLARTLDALYQQVDLKGVPLAKNSYEVLLLLNNCSDESGNVAKLYRRQHPELQLHVVECVLPNEEAHVGTARRMLMDAACSRFERSCNGAVSPDCAILSTDADSVVSPNWIIANLMAIGEGAEVVGGVVDLLPGELESLDEGTRLAYTRDREFQELVAQLESILDPDPADPWPRHLQHFGASLACTCAVYRLSGGLPPAKHLEDVAFIDALRKVGACIRHSPKVHVYTSARFHGRVETGLSGQLRQWQRETIDDAPQLVDSAEWLQHRFSTLSRLRRLNEAETTPSISAFPAAWHEMLCTLHAEQLPTARFLELLDCDGLIDEMFTKLQGVTRNAEITQVLHRLQVKIRTLDSF